MSRVLNAGLAAAALFLAAGCHQSEQSQQSETPETPAPTVIESMTQVMDPQSQAFWNASFDAMNNAGDIVPEKLTDEQMSQMRAAVASVRDHAQQFAGADHVVVAPEGVKILNEGMEGALGAAEVQALIDADPQGFAEKSQELVTIADNVIAGLDNGDLRKLNDAAIRFNDICTECHSEYWYPSD